VGQVTAQIQYNYRDEVRDQCWGLLHQLRAKLGDQHWNQIEGPLRRGLVESWDQVRALVLERSLESAWDQLGDEFWHDAWNQVEDQYRTQTWPQHWNQIRADALEKAKAEVRDEVLDQVWVQLSRSDKPRTRRIERDLDGRIQRIVEV
jgi:hypothetical protein